MAKKLLPSSPFDNINIKWAWHIVNELLINEIDFFVISPGHRSVPLISALVNFKAAKKVLAVDERAAAYLALGYSKRSRKPPVLICTSGTALANYYPALIEANREELPIIVLSSDRPQELTQSDSNQTIDQSKMFSHFCKHYLPLATPTKEIPLSAILSDINYALKIAQTRPASPIHINAPFREPFFPLPPKMPPKNASPYFSSLPFTKIFTSEDPANTASSVASVDIATVLTLLLPKATNQQESNSQGKVVLVVGSLSNREDILLIEESLNQLFAHGNFLVHFDILSSLRTLQSFSQKFTLLRDFDLPETIDYLNRLLNNFRITTIIHLGGRVISNKYYEWLREVREFRNTQNTQNTQNAQDTRNKLLPEIIQINPSPFKRDPAHAFNRKIEISVSNFCQQIFKLLALTSRCREMPRSKEAKRSISKKEIIPSSLKIPARDRSYFKIVQSIAANIPDRSYLLLGNSMSVRLFNSYLYPFFLPGTNKKFILVEANRGVSGIEGTLACAVGLGHSSSFTPITVVLGDLAFLHDLNSLKLVSDYPGRIAIILLNNFGGEIFKRLPVARYPHILRPLTTSPHTLTFKKIVESFSLNYFTITMGGGDFPPEKQIKFKTKYLSSFKSNSKKSIVIEILL